MDKPLATVSVLYQSNARQIPEMMRKLAGEVESPPVAGSTVDQAVAIVRDSKTGQLNFYAWGDVDINSTFAMLAIAQQRLGLLAFGGDLWKIPQGGSTPKDSA